MEVREAERRDVTDLLRLNVELHEYSAQGVPSRLRIADRYDDESRRSYMDEVLSVDTATHCVAIDGHDWLRGDPSPTAGAGRVGIGVCYLNRRSTTTSLVVYDICSAAHFGL
jgi:hypothetical protein